MESDKENRYPFLNIVTKGIDMALGQLPLIANGIYNPGRKRLGQSYQLH